MPSDPVLAALDEVQRGQRAPSAPDPVLAALADVQADQSRGWVARAAPTALRVGGGVAGAILGSFVAPGVGTAGGGALGSGLGDYLAQQLEQSRGEREDTSLPQLGIQTVLGAIPGMGPGKTLLGTIGKSAAQGGLLGGGAVTAESVLERGELPSAGEVATGAGLGAAFGGALGGAVDGGRRLVTGLQRRTPPTPTPQAQLPPPPFRAAPDGRVAPPGVEIPMTRQPDGSFVRGVPAEYARRDVAGLLPAGREPLITPPPPGSIRGDSSFVRSVPAQYGQPVIRGLLPEGRPAIITPPPPGSTPRTPPTPDDARVRSVPAAIAEREIDPHVPAREAVKVRQYSGDVEAVDAPFVTDDQRRWLERMREDLAEFTPERGALVPMRDVRAGDPFLNRPNIGGGAHYVAPTPGSPVADDIRIISRQNVSQQDIAGAIDDLLAGKAPTNRLHTAAIDAANGYAEGREGYRGPALPFDWKRGGGGAPGAVDDFERFARMVDEIEPAPIGTEAGESGFIAASLVPKLGGAAAGAAVGGATGDSPEDRAARALLGAGAGFAGGALAARQLARQSPRIIEGLRPRQTGSGQRLRPVEGLRPIGAQGGPIRDPLKGFEPFLSKFSNPLVRDGVRERLTAHAGLQAQRRGVINVQQQARLAERVAVDVSRSLPKGTPLNAEQVTAYARAVDKTMGEVQRLSAVVNSGKATDADLLALKAAEADHAVVLASLVGARAEAGRALQAFRAFSGAIGTGDVNLIRAATKGLREDAQQLAQKVIAAGPDPLARYEVLKQSTSATLMDKARSYYYANILSGVKTHERNFLGNTFNAMSNLLVHPVAAGIDAARAAATGTPRTVTLGELPHQVVGTFAGVERGIRDFAFTLRHGISPDRLVRTVGQAEQHGQFDLPRVELPGGGANPLNYPGRLLDAADALFRSVNRNAELYGQAYTKARAQGLRGTALQDRVASVIAGVASDAGDLHEQAATFATRAVFQEQPGNLAGRLQGIVRDYPVLAFVVPFVKTPANILRQGLEFSPAGMFMQAATQAGRPGVQAQARVAAGTAAAGALAWLAATGRLSGSGPRDQAERAALMESGWRPNSIRIGNQWVSYSLFQPVSVQAAIVANAFEAWRAAGAKADAASAAASTVFRSIDSFLDQSFLSGLFDVVQAISRGEVSPDSSMRMAGRTAHSLTPLAGLQRTVRDAVDPVQHKPETAGDAFRVNVPGASASVRPRVDRFGEVVTREGGPGRRAVDPFNVSSVTTDRVAGELDRLGVRLNLPADTISRRGERVALTSQQEVALQQLKGRAIRFALERVMDSPAYQRLDDEQRARRLERTIDAARQRASRRAPRELGLDLRAAAAQ